ncbi:hypothetical protein ACFQMB_18525 [Pseudobowmanella zhangzhouensis]|uniref:hypothetical protein n=1 Tax=Pseudobowmanella zhangzhouensis TaxID=1537679 RepID=UPI00360AB06A
MAQSGTARDALPDFHLPDGLITLNGRVGEPSLNSFIRETASGAQPGLVRVQQFDPVWIEQHYQLQVLPLMLYVTEPGELRRDWQPVVMPLKNIWPMRFNGLASHWPFLLFSFLQ